MIRPQIDRGTQVKPRSPLHTWLSTFTLSQHHPTRTHLDTLWSELYTSNYLSTNPQWSQYQKQRGWRSSKVLRSLDCICKIHQSPKLQQRQIAKSKSTPCPPTFADRQNQPLIHLGPLPSHRYPLCHIDHGIPLLSLEAMYAQDPPQVLLPHQCRELSLCLV